ncbi:MAG TPA: PKD domain-containing protein [Mycobacteriales bacterium]|nr:PKD domain-containing protein [Mycobacteriales bacterium]
MRTRRPLIAAVALTIAGAVVPAAVVAAPAKPVPKCFGKKATIVATGNNKTVNGTKHNDVIVALGKGDKVSGKGGNDLICTKAAKSVDAGPGNDKVQFGSGKILGGAGNDTLTQAYKGKAQVFGGAGNDTIKLITKGNLVDSGTGLDVLIVAPALLDFQTIIPRDGLTINGVTPRIDAPKGAPTADISFDGDPGPIVYATTAAAYDFTSSDDSVALRHVLPPNGRTLKSWQIDFGDGSVHSGPGGLPAYFPHSYLTDGSHVIVATQTDSSGRSTTRSITVNTSRRPTADLAVTSNNTATGDVVFNTTGTKAGSGATLTSWFIDFGDGTTTGNVGAPPATISHTYPISSSNWEAVLYVTDDHGSQDYDYSDYVQHYAPDGNLHLYAAPTVSTTNITGHLETYGNIGSAGTQSGAPLPVNGTVLTGQYVELNEASANTDGITVNWGDGCVITQYPGTSPNYVSQNADICTASYGSFNYHQYSGPGARTITITVQQDGGTPPSLTLTYQVTVVARQTVAHLNRVGIVGQGPVKLSTAGTTFAPGAHFWALYFGDDSAPIYGTGAVPASVVHVYPSGVYYPYLVATDHFGLISQGQGFVDATSVRARVAGFDAYEGDDPGAGQWTPALVATDASGDAAVHFSGVFVPSVGAQPKVASISFGDGAVQTVPGFEDGSFGSYTSNYSEYQDAVHGYSQPGDFLAVLSAKDTKGQVATASRLVSVGGRVAIGSPDYVTVNAQAAQPTVLATVTPGASYGTNSGPLGWSVYWDDPTPLPNGDTNASAGQGAIPAAVAHTYPNPGPSNTADYDVYIDVANDHGSTLVRHVVLHIVGA